jgi:hypothetical protein
MTDHQNDARDDALGALLRANAPDRFDPGFSERVLARLHGEQLSLTAALQRQFLRIVPLAAAAALLLAAINWWGGRSTDASVIEAALNLPQVSLSTAYSSTASYEGADPTVGMP